MDLTEDRFEMPRRAVVLFAGAGGSSIGLHDAGFEPIGFEYWRTAADTHRANGMSCVHVDLSDPTSDEYTTINGDVRVSAPGHHDPTVSGSQQAGALQLTIKELARLQDFPDHYVWCGTKTDQAKQIGNAVPATMARVLAEANAPIGVAA